MARPGQVLPGAPSDMTDRVKESLQSWRCEQMDLASAKLRERLGSLGVQMRTGKNGYGLTYLRLILVQPLVRLR
jgi:hypothetical protein